MCKSRLCKLCNGFYSDVRPINRGFLYLFNVFFSLLCPGVMGQRVATEKAYAGSRGEHAQSDLYVSIHDQSDAVDLWPNSLTSARAHHGEGPAWVIVVLRIYKVQWTIAKTDTR